MSPFPADRGWAVGELFAGSRRSGFKEIHDCGGFLTRATTFDPEFFGISPREAVVMDPQQRVALRVCWRALENSGINPDDMAGHDLGCYLGASATGYGPRGGIFQYSGHLLAGTALSVISGRVAYTLGSTGPAVTIDSSCASALVAFHAAVRAVQDGDCDLALAGGVNVLGSPGFFVEFSKQHALSDDGHCRAYSAQASGTVWSEGAAVFVLQRKSAAQRDGRQILAEVLGTAVNHDGRSAGLSAPSGTAQVKLFRRAMSEAQSGPKTSACQGRGTGTRLGDRTELQSLAQTYSGAEPGGGALLGSVKSNLGHALAASGALGLAKVLVAAEHAAIPATLHAADASPEIEWDKQGVRLAATLTPWPAIDGRRVAATSAFGIAGTNAHVIVSLPEVA